MLARIILLALCSTLGFGAELGLGPLPPSTAIWGGASAPTSGYVLFSNGTIATGDAAFAWDNTNKRATIPLNLTRVTFNNAAYIVLAGGCYTAQVGTMSASRAVTLPAATVGAGAVVIIADESGTVTGTNTIVATRAGSDTINGLTTWTMGRPYCKAIMVSDGTSKWTVVDGYQYRGCPFLFWSDCTQHSLANPGDTVEHIQVTSPSLANVVPVGGSLTIRFIGAMTNSGNTKTWNIRTNTGGGGVGGTAWVSAAPSTSNASWIKDVTYFLRDSTTWVATQNTGSNSYGVVTVAVNTITQDSTAAWTLDFNLKLATGTETVTYEAIQLIVCP